MMIPDLMFLHAILMDNKTAVPTILFLALVLMNTLMQWIEYSRIKDNLLK